LDQSDCPPDDSDNRQRIRYFTGQLLGQDDLEGEQEYHRAALRRHNRALHGWGVASGFEVTPSTSQVSEVVVFPGYALDQCGREVILTEAVTITVPAGTECFVAARAVETLVSDATVRDDVEVAVVSDPYTCWIVLASIQLKGDQLVLDSTVQRLLSRN
jgi:hypothetical protein